MKVEKEGVFFTTIDPKSEVEYAINIASTKDSLTFGIDSPEITVDDQQAMELGCLLLAYSANNKSADVDSIFDMLDGYGFKQDELNGIAARLREIADALQD